MIEPNISTLIICDGSQEGQRDSKSNSACFQWTSSLVSLVASSFTNSSNPQASPNHYLRLGQGGGKRCWLLWFRFHHDTWDISPGAGRWLSPASIEGTCLPSWSPRSDSRGCHSRRGCLYWPTVSSVKRKIETFADGHSGHCGHWPFQGGRATGSRYENNTTRKDTLGWMTDRSPCTIEQDTNLLANFFVSAGELPRCDSDRSDNISPRLTATFGTGADPQVEEHLFLARTSRNIDFGTNEGQQRKISLCRWVEDAAVREGTSKSNLDLLAVHKGATLKEFLVSVTLLPSCVARENINLASEIRSRGRWSWSSWRSPLVRGQPDNSASR